MFLWLEITVFDDFYTRTSFDLKSRNISKMEDSAIFGGLTKLKSLILSENRLYYLPEGIFNGLSNLRTL